MKPLRCLLGKHRFGGWVEVGWHLERKCLECGYAQARFPSAEVMFAKFLVDCAELGVEAYLKHRFG